MAKTLILFRHGKSDWETGIKADHDRPLAKRGIKAAKAMGRMLAEAGQTPELAIASTAVRATATLDLAVQSGSWPARCQTDASLYATTPPAVLQIVNALPPETTSVMLVGHETCWSELVALLAGGGRIRFPTAAMARLDFDLETWSSIRPGTGELVWLIPPRFIGNGNQKA